jgi:hypothetical protein
MAILITHIEFLRLSRELIQHLHPLLVIPPFVVEDIQKSNAPTRADSPEWDLVILQQAHQIGARNVQDVCGLLR